ncbi:MAG: ATP-binding protein [Acidobacteriota bacterium]|nr:ATP-binding protein [Acidobacteriota bacterium]
MRRALPLSIQLLLTFVGLLIGLAAVLTTAAHRTLRTNLETDATRHVSLATRSREQTLTQLFQLRQQRAEGFLATVVSYCGEPTNSPRLAWADTCVEPMMEEFRKSERAVGALLTYRNRPLRRSGRRVAPEAPIRPALARVVRTPDGAIEYVMKAERRDLALTLQFNDDQVTKLFFEDAGGIGRSADVFLLEAHGQFLTPTAHAAETAVQSDALLARCRSGADAFVDLDFGNVRSFQSFRPVAVLGDACVGASLRYAETLAPADRLRAVLVERVFWFVIAGALLSLIAAQWISAPVRRLAQSARKLQAGHFERPLPLRGPSEVRALGHAFNEMSNELAELVAKEQTARREAEEANRSKDDFLATVSHELRTPLTAVLGWAHMLRAPDVPADRMAHGLAVIERSARAQSRLIEDLLDVSRIASNRLRMTHEPVKMADVVEQALDQIHPQAAEKQVEIHSELTDSGLVLGDARRLEQVVSNLVWNAIKFTDPQGHINLRLSRGDREMVLSVTDTGVGISSAFLPYVFEWFRQEDPRSRSQSGLGLGLGITRHILQLHGGGIRAESRGAGLGATFTVTLPVHEPGASGLQPRAEAQPRSASAAQRLYAARVLVVEDDEDARDLVRVTLEAAGAYVETVSSASDARREILAGPPDVLISDVRMPEEDGYSLIRSLRRDGVATPAIALTSYARKEDADQARAAGFQIHLSKPVDASRLVDAVAALLPGDCVH